MVELFLTGIGLHFAQKAVFYLGSKARDKIIGTDLDRRIASCYKEAAKSLYEDCKEEGWPEQRLEALANVLILKEVQELIATSLFENQGTCTIETGEYFKVGVVKEGETDASDEETLAFIRGYIEGKFIPDIYGLMPQQIKNADVRLHDIAVRERFDALSRKLDRLAPGAGEPRVSYWGGRPASLDEGFIGRDEDIEALANAFAGKQAFVISGGAGCGKTRLAAEYAHRREGDGFWTASGSTLALTLAALAPALGINQEAKSSDEVATEVENRLAPLPNTILWVIDNLPDLDQVNALLHVIDNIRIIATTRDSRRGICPTAGFMRIEALKPDAAITLLCSRSDTRPEDPAVQEIVEKVGRLPMALETLAARLSEPLQTPEKVLERLKQAPTAIQLKIFEESAGMTIPRAGGVFATIAGTLEDLPENIRQSLNYLGYLADAPVSGALMTALTGLSDEELAELLTACSRNSVLAWVDEHAVIHSLTAAAIAATNPERALAEFLDRIVNRLIAINTDDPVALRDEMAHYETAYARAREAFGVDDENTLYLANNLAIGYWSVGRTEEATRLDEESLEVSERVLGKEHPSTLTSRNNLAIDYRAIGRFEEAIRLDEETLEIRERVLGPEHPDTLISRNNLAIGYRAAGRTKDAIRLDEETLKIMERVLGREHPSTLASRNNLAIDYRDVGRTEEAIRLDEETLEIRERVLGHEHPDTLQSRNGLGHRLFGGGAD